MSDENLMFATEEQQAIYNKQQDSYSIIETQEDIYAKTADYTINMSIDSINYKDKDQLLIKKIEYLQNIEM